MELKIGCCGFASGKKNYFKRFDLVEIQNTFYMLPKSETALKWRQDAPGDFQFSVKTWQLITHSPKSPTYRRANIIIEKDKQDRYGLFRPTDEVLNAWEKTLEICKILKAKIVVFQCPASFKPSKENIGNMRSFFSSIKRDSIAVAWEPRGEWSADVIRKICADFKLIHCVDPFKNMQVTKKKAYFRLHGQPPGKVMYNYRYTKDDLQLLKKKCAGFDEIHCLFNNINMYENALEFMDIMGIQPP